MKIEIDRKFSFQFRCQLYFLLESKKKIMQVFLFYQIFSRFMYARICSIALLPSFARRWIMSVTAEIGRKKQALFHCFYLHFMSTIAHLWVFHVCAFAHRWSNANSLLSRKRKQTESISIAADFPFAWIFSFQFYSITSITTLILSCCVPARSRPKRE